MKAKLNFLGAVSAAALMLAWAMPASLAIQAATVSQAHAAVVRSIAVEGNRRVDDETVRNYVNIKPGVPFNGGDINEGVKNLFATGLFSDVTINQRGSTLVIVVEEYPIVNQVLFQGNKKVKDADLSNRVQLKARGIYTDSAREIDEETIRESYRRIGRNDAIVTSRIIEVGDNRVNVVFEVVEGGRTKIDAIDFVGNNAYSDRRLRDVISTKRSNIFSFLFRGDVYDENRLQADEETLRQFYYNRGYADFRIIASESTLDETENEYRITITVDEGERYNFGAISVESTIDGIDPDSLNSLVETREGKVYSAKNVEDTLIALTEYAAGRGYAFAEVTPRGDRDFGARTISVVYQIDEGPRTYIQRIEIRGNSRTRDYVIRREFEVAEGDAFNQVLVQRAKRRLEDLDYFDVVNISTVPGSEPDQVILVVDVKEKATGEFSIGAGYATGGSNQGVSVEGSISERNFLGRGQFVKFSIGGGKDSRNYAVSFTEPYFLGRRIAAGFDIYKQTREYDNYDSDLVGGTVRFGLPITNAISTQLAYNYSQEDYSYTDAALGVCPNLNTSICPVATSIQSAIATSPWIKSSVSATLLYNTIDDTKNPRNGIYATFTTEYAGIGGDAKFLKFTGRGQYYQEIYDEADIVGVLTAGAGHIESTGSGGLRQFDLFENSDRIIRGFEYDGIGPVDAATGDHLGGTTYFHASAEAQFPIPIIPESIGLRGAVFVDAATLYGNSLAGVNPASTSMEWRASAGASLIWQSPFGPLRVDYAVPFLKEPTDEVENFNFGVTGRF